MNKTISVIITILVLFLVWNKISASAKIIPDEAIRLRVIPNSDSSYDQEVKEKVSVSLQSKMYDLLKDTKGIDEARNVISSNLVSIDNTVSKVLISENYNLGYKIDYGYHYFPEKEFKGITYDDGEYESLLVTLGKGEGSNWWCVLFPPLCLLEADETDKDEVEYKFFLQEIIDKYL